MPVYVYGLLRSPARPDLAGAPPGLPGAGSPRALDAGSGHWLVVADAAGEELGEAAIGRWLDDLGWVSEQAVGHESVLDHLLATAAPLLPAKLFTLFNDDARAVADLRERREALDRAFDRVDGAVEWGLRVRLGAARPAAPAAAVDRPAGGREFLLRKKSERDEARARPAELRGRMEELFAEAAAAAREARRRPPEAAAGAGADLLLDAAFLVPTAETERFERVVRSWAERLAPLGGEVTLTGPWPAYNFVEEAP